MKSIKTLYWQIPLAISACLCAAAAMAQAPKDAGDRRGPPAEAILACKALSAGASCSFTSPQRSATGTCFAPEGKPLACRPSNAPAGPGGKAPKG